MGDIAAYLKTEKLTISDIRLTPHELAELIASIKKGTISGKIGKEVHFIIFFLLISFCYSLLFVPSAFTMLGCLVNCLCHGLVQCYS